MAVTSPEINDVVYSIMKNNSLSSVWLGVTEKVSTWKWLKGRRIFTFIDKINLGGIQELRGDIKIPKMWSSTCR